MDSDRTFDEKTARSKVAIVYLDRWGNPPRFPRIFLSSLTRFLAGADFDIIWQMKGYPQGAQSEPLKKFHKRFQGEIHELHYSDDQYQFSLSIDAAEKFGYDYLLFFTSWSRILAPNWLKFYLDAFANNVGCGIVGATGSFEQHTTDQPYPNVHVRTNAYMVRRDLYLSLDFGRLESKAAGYLVEAGPNSITKQILDRGLEVLLINRFGDALPPLAWPHAHIYRSGDQEALLVADNHTYAYSKASNRRELVQLAWRDAAPVTKSSWLKPALARLRWHAPELARWIGL